jgi:hypothetical protein
MNRAVATIRGIRRSLFIEIRGDDIHDGKQREEGLYHPIAA